MRSCAWLSTLLAMAAIGPARADDKAAEAALQANGLKKFGTTYVLPQEAEVGRSFAALQRLQKDYLLASGQARALEREAREARAMIIELTKQRLQLNQQLRQAGSTAEYNQLANLSNEVTDRLNLLQATVNDPSGLQSAREQAGRRREAFVQGIVEARPEIDALIGRYDELGKEPAVAGALADLNRTAKAKVGLGPSKSFQTQQKAFEKVEATLMTEVIPLQPDGGVNRLDVTLNGKITRSMILDTGASSISIPSEVAAQAGILPGPDAPKVEVSIADGRKFEARQVVLDSVRVGKFTAEKVECIVMPPEFANAPMLLGGSYLRNFIAKISPDARTLQLSRIDEPASADPSARPGKGGATPRKK